jgi:hypothetical protein
VQAVLPVDTVPARCNCTAEHPNRPDGTKDGCGVGSGPPVQIAAK